MIFGYARCSTNESLQDVNRQVRELIELGATQNTIYKEYESGTKRDRVELNRLLEVLTEGDTVITTEVSRLSRSMKDLLDILDIFKGKKVKVIIGSFILDFTKDESDPMVMAMVQMLGVFSQMERDIISNRVKSGMENAKSKGVKLGRKSTTKDDIPSIFLKHYPKYVNKQINVTEFSRLTNLSRPSIYKYLKLLKEDN